MRESPVPSAGAGILARPRQRAQAHSDRGVGWDGTEEGVARNRLADRQRHSWAATGRSAGHVPDFDPTGSPGLTAIPEPNAVHRMKVADSYCAPPDPASLGGAGLGFEAEAGVTVPSPGPERTQEGRGGTRRPSGERGCSGRGTGGGYPLARPERKRPVPHGRGRRRASGPAGSGGGCQAAAGIRARTHCWNPYSRAAIRCLPRESGAFCVRRATFGRRPPPDSHPPAGHAADAASPACIQSPGCPTSSAPSSRAARRSKV